MTIDDVAAALGVSKATVSRAITGNGRISSETRERILYYMDKHNFRPNAIAQNLAAKQTLNIAFTVPSEREFSEIPFFLRCLIAVSDTASRRSYDVVIVPCEGSDISGVERVVGNQKVDGVIVSRNTDDSAMLDYLLASGIPFTLIGSTDRPGVIQIDNDHRGACRELTSRLLDDPGWRGVKLGMLIGSPSYVVNVNRMQGFMDALREHGMDADDVDIRWDMDEGSLLQAFDEMYFGGVRRFFCADDAICGYLLHHLHRGVLAAGPGEIRVASFYNSRSMEQFNPDVPTVDFDVDSVGRCTCDLLIRRMAGEDVPPKTLLGHRIIMNDNVTP